MKKIIFILLLGAFVLPVSLRAQITNVIVEKYYVSDANDATDTIDGPARALPEGSATYRVYIQLQPGSKLRKIYGDTSVTYHPLIISSTQEFYNNVDRTQAYFGYLINKSWFSSNPLLALDSWLTLGQTTTTSAGILKTQDSDGCVAQILNNGGGTASIPGGLLKNADPDAGIPLYSADGLVPNTAPSGQWSDNGFIGYDSLLGNVDTTVFGPVKKGSEFFGKYVELQRSPGITATADSNKILVAQLTTKGELSFQFNVIVEVPDGASYDIINYVATGSDTSYQAGSNIITERVCPFLKYPPVCGCTDPHYLEYSSNYTCSNSDSCRTLIKLGCMDVMACNYDPTANYNVPMLCCYPGRCNDRDIASVCPALREKQIHLYPNPAQSEISLQVVSDEDEDAICRIYDCQGKLMLEKNIPLASGVSLLHLDIAGLDKGVYMLRVFMRDDSIGKIFFKN
jgi:hypothetical protein